MKSSNPFEGAVRELSDEQCRRILGHLGGGGGGDDGGDGGELEAAVDVLEGDLVHGKVTVYCRALIYALKLDLGADGTLASDQELAEELKVSRPAISTIRKGHVSLPSFFTAIQLLAEIRMKSEADVIRELLTPEEVALFAFAYTITQLRRRFEAASATELGPFGLALLLAVLARRSWVASLHDAVGARAEAQLVVQAASQVHLSEATTTDSDNQLRAALRNCSPDGRVQEILKVTEAWGQYATIVLAALWHRVPSYQGETP